MKNGYKINMKKCRLDYIDKRIIYKSMREKRINVKMLKEFLKSLKNADKIFTRKNIQFSN